MTRTEYLKSAIEEMTRYERNWGFMTAREKREIGCTKAELKRRIAEYEDELKKEVLK